MHDDERTGPPEENSDVGISIISGEEADAIVEVLSAELGKELRVTDHGTYLKLETSSGQLEVRFDDVADVLGKPFSLTDFQIIFSSYYGRPQVFEDKIGVYTSMTAGVIADGNGSEHA